MQEPDTLIREREESKMEQVDPGTALILSALGAALKDTASQASKDAYNWLKGLLKRRMAGRPDAERALAEYESAPDVNELQLKEVLLQTRAYEDEEILDAARKVLSVVKTQQQAIGKYNVQAESVQGLVQGEHAQVEMNFGTPNKPSEK